MCLLRRSARGMTLIELLLVVAIVGTLSALALPDLRTWVRGQRVSSLAREVFFALSIGRSEAIKTGQTVSVILDDSRRQLSVESGETQIYPASGGNSGRFRIPRHMSIRFVTPDDGLLRVVFNSSGHSVGAEQESRPVRLIVADRHPTIENAKEVVVMVTMAGAVRIE